MATLMILVKEFFYLLLALGVASRFHRFKGLVTGLRATFNKSGFWQMGVKIDEGRKSWRQSFFL